MKKVIDIEIQPDLTGIRSLNSEIAKMRSDLDKATDPKEIDRLNKALKKTESEVEAINKEVDKFSMGKKFDDVYKDLAPLSSRLGELEDRMYELAFAGQANTDEFRALQKEAIGMRQTIIEVDKQVDILADNRGMSAFGDGIDEVGMSLGRLDFDTASKQAATLARAASEISFGSALKSLKQFGSTIVSLGKAILVNPIFLLATVVFAIGAAIYKLLDELGVLKVIFEAIGDAIGWVVQQFKDMMDWLGLTSYAAEDAADRQAEAAKKAADAQEAASERVINALDHEIRRIQATGDESDEAFEKILAAEKEKRVQLFLTAKARAHEAVAAAEAAMIKGDLDEQEIKDLQDKAMAQIQLAKQANEEIITADLEADQKRRERLKNQEKEEADSYKTKLDNHKKYLADRLRAERQIEDLRIQALDDGFDKEIEKNFNHYQRLIEDTKSSQELLESEKLAIIEKYEQLASQKEAELRQKRRDEDAAELAALQAQADAEVEIFMAAELRKEEARMAAQEQAEAEAKEAREKELAAEKELAQAKGDLLVSGFQLAADVAQLFANRSEKAAKIAFNIQKIAAISQATLDGYRAVLSTYAQTPGGPVIKGIAAGLAGAFSAAQIAKIASTQFQGGGASGVSNVNAPSGGGAEMAAQQQNTNLSLFGNSNNLNTFGQPQSNEQGGGNVIQAVVSLEQLSTSQDKQAMIYQNGLLK